MFGLYFAADNSKSVCLKYVECGVGNKMLYKDASAVSFDYTLRILSPLLEHISSPRLCPFDIPSTSDTKIGIPSRNPDIQLPM